MKLTLEQLEVGQRKIMGNVEDLITESKILLDNNRYAKSYFLSSIAKEEIGKYFLIFIDQTINLLENESEFYENTYKKHGMKRVIYFVIDYLLPMLQRTSNNSQEDIVKLQTRIEEDIYKFGDDIGSINIDNKIKDEENLKMKSLYVDIDGINFIHPTESINKELATSNLELVKNYLNSVELFKDNIKNLDDDNKENFKKVFQLTGLDKIIHFLVIGTV